MAARETVDDGEGRRPWDQRTGGRRKRALLQEPRPEPHWWPTRKEAGARGRGRELEGAPFGGKTAAVQLGPVESCD